jgi:ABC-type glycerol-3-phosphate transport system substrate-binding protein
MNHFSWYQKKVNWDIGWPPAVPGAKNRTYSSVGADGIVYKGTKHPTEAWKLVQYFISKDSQMKKAKSRLVVPVMKSALRSEVYLQAPPANMRVIGDMLENADDLPVFNYFLDVMAILDRHMNLAASGKKSAESACIDAEAEANKFLISRRKK